MAAGCPCDEHPSGDPLEEAWVIVRPPSQVAARVQPHYKDDYDCNK